ncbi:MAG: lipid-A-disaccharide synthase-related protein [Candidatus Margulisbacteria bacterium]|jgi:uncharacterized protein (TIGR03492 family)|nr:lipid-A-disaccharide synthase-related protein [Candidatus Margulisiibacteriota bacterium]
MEMKRGLLIISNGKGEDSIAVTLLEKLKLVAKEEAAENIGVVALPLVGEGLAYKDREYYAAASWRVLPSHGFTSPAGLCRDLRRGLLDNFRQQAKIIYREAANADLLVTVGDIMPLLLAAFYGRGRKIAHIATAVSAYLRSYSLPEIWLFKKYVNCVVCRDLRTCEELQKNGVNAFYSGNPMMDDPLLAPEQINLGLDKRRRRIVLVPSSRADAYLNILRMLEIVRRFPPKNNFQFVLTMAPGLELDLLGRMLAAETEWRLDEQPDKRRPISAELLHANAPPVIVISGHFRACLDGAVLALGMTGTGNEQIAGLGIPLALFRGRSPAASGRRMRHYKKLLGEAVFIPRGSDRRKAESLNQLLGSGRQLQRMSEAGRERIGAAGGAYHIARKIWYYLHSA